MSTRPATVTFSMSNISLVALLLFTACNVILILVVYESGVPGVVRLIVPNGRVKAHDTGLDTPPGAMNKEGQKWFDLNSIPETSFLNHYSNNNDSELLWQKNVTFEGQHNFMCQTIPQPVKTKADCGHILMKAIFCDIATYDHESSICSLFKSKPTANSAVSDMSPLEISNIVGSVEVAHLKRDNNVKSAFYTSRAETRNNVKHSTNYSLFDSDSIVDTLGTVTVVVSIGAEFLILNETSLLSWEHVRNEESRHTCFALYCWAQKHSYKFVVVPIFDEDIAHGNHFFDARWRKTLNHILTNSTYTLHLDADTIPLQPNISITQFMLPFKRAALRRSNERPTVLLHMRENGEVTASAALFRNSITARCFLKLWNYVDTWPQNVDIPNWDNGALLFTIARLVSDEDAQVCERQLMQAVNDAVSDTDNANMRIVVAAREYNDKYLQCFSTRIVQHILTSRLDPSFSWLHIFFQREGFWRSHEGLINASSPDIDPVDRLVTQCTRTDVLGHGWKRMGLSMVPSLDTCQEPRGCNAIETNRDAEQAVQFCCWFHPQYNKEVVTACSSVENTGKVAVDYRWVRMGKIASTRIRLSQHQFKGLFERPSAGFSSHNFTSDL